MHFNDFNFKTGALNHSATHPEGVTGSNRDSKGSWKVRKAAEMLLHELVRSNVDDVLADSVLFVKSC